MLDNTEQMRTHLTMYPTLILVAKYKPLGIVPFHCNVHKKIQPERQLHAASLCGESALIGRKKTALSSY